MNNESTPATECLTVLVIEDVRNLSFLMRRSLERAGHFVTTCPTAEAALEFLDLSSFDLISLDNSLPDMSGLDFLRKLNQEGNTTPVIMVTCYGDGNLVNQAMAAGALDFIHIDPSLNFLVGYPERVAKAARFKALKDENTTLQEENVRLKAQLAAITAENEALKRKVK
jgi:two-component system response regulator (stage 0 sporulation protein F)